MSGRQSLVRIPARRSEHNEHLLAMVSNGEHTYHHTGQLPYRKGL
jgi:hypothetical protein